MPEKYTRATLYRDFVVMWLYIYRYIQRHTEELDKMVELQSGRTRLASHHRLQHASREDILRQIVHGEMQLFQTSGFGMEH